MYAQLLIGGVGTAFIGYLFLRKILHELFPSFIPGESIATLLATPSILKKHKKEDGSVEWKGVKEYDYIIAGGGTAACVLANRLSEDPNTTVLVIEAGFSDVKQLMSRIPGGYSQLFRTASDWNLRTAPQKTMSNREMYWPRGKMLGGCSSINAMIYTRCSPDDYDEWEKRYGCEGWGWKDLEPMFKKSEGFTPSQQNPVDLSNHNRNGLWKIGYAFLSSFNTLAVKAIQSSGMPHVQDFNTSKGLLGSGRFQTFIDEHGRRSSTAVAFITEEVAKRPNLSILVGQQVTKVFFNENGGKIRAEGVEMGPNALSPLRFLAKANKEVILCAGAVHTPQIMMLSGLGPAQHLKEKGIRVVKDIPEVGGNLYDHLSFGLNFKTKPGTSCQSQATNPVAGLKNLYRWLSKDCKDNFLTTCVAEVAGFFRMVDREDCPKKVKDMTSGKNSPDVEILAAPLTFMDHGRIQPPPGDYGTLGGILLRPESTGRISLQDSNPFTPPSIDANYLSTESDQQCSVYIYKKMIEIAQSKELSGIKVGWHEPSNPDQLSDDEILQLLRDSSETIYHPVGTAKMGREKDGAVVDTHLRVYGVEGLRVCDASVMPNIVAGHTCAPVVAIAERLACIMKEEKAN